MVCPHCRKEIANDEVVPVVITTGEEFEQYLCDRINALGSMSCRMTRRTGDQGADLIITKGDNKIAVQCKLYSKPVGNDAVQEAIAGKVFYKCNAAWVVTNNIFTDAAYKLAEAADVRLFHYTDMLKCLKMDDEDGCGDPEFVRLQNLASQGSVIAKEKLIFRKVGQHCSNVLDIVGELLNLVGENIGYTLSKQSCGLVARTLCDEAEKMMLFGLTDDAYRLARLSLRYGKMGDEDVVDRSGAVLQSVYRKWGWSKGVDCDPENAKEDLLGLLAFSEHSKYCVKSVEALIRLDKEISEEERELQMRDCEKRLKTIEGMMIQYKKLNAAR